MCNVDQNENEVHMNGRDYEHAHMSMSELPLQWPCVVPVTWHLSFNRASSISIIRVARNENAVATFCPFLAEAANHA